MLSSADVYDTPSEEEDESALIARYDAGAIIQFLRHYLRAHIDVSCYVGRHSDDTDDQQQKEMCNALPIFSHLFKCSLLLRNKSHYAGFHQIGRTAFYRFCQ